MLLRFLTPCWIVVVSLYGDVAKASVEDLPGPNFHLNINVSGYAGASSLSRLYEMYDGGGEGDAVTSAADASTTEEEDERSTKDAGGKDLAAKATSKAAGEGKEGGSDLPSVDGDESGDDYGEDYDDDDPVDVAADSVAEAEHYSNRLAIIHISTSLRAIKENPNAPEDVFRRVVGAHSARFFEGVTANDTELVKDYVMQTMTSSEAAGLSLTQAKVLLLLSLRGSLRDVVGVMLAHGLQLKYAAKLMLSLAVEETRMQEILASYERSHLAMASSSPPTAEEVLRKTKEVVLLLLSDAIVREVPEEAEEAMKTDLFLMKMAKWLPGLYIDSFRGRGFAMEEVAKLMAKKEELLDEILSLGKEIAKEATPKNEPPNRAVERAGGDIKTGETDRKEDPISDLVQLEIGTAIKEGGGIDQGGGNKNNESNNQIKRSTEDATSSWETMEKVVPSVASWETIEHGDNGEGQGSTPESEEEDADEGESSREEDGEGHESKDYFDPQTYVNEYDDSDRGDNDYDDDENEEDYFEGEEEEEEEGEVESNNKIKTSRHDGDPGRGEEERNTRDDDVDEVMADSSTASLLPPVTERTSKSSEESQSYDSLYDDLVDEGTIGI